MSRRHAVRTETRRRVPCIDVGDVLWAGLLDEVFKEFIESMVCCLPQNDICVYVGGESPRTPDFSFGGSGAEAPDPDS